MLPTQTPYPGPPQWDLHTNANELQSLSTSLYNCNNVVFDGSNYINGKCNVSLGNKYNLALGISIFAVLALIDLGVYVGDNPRHKRVTFVRIGLDFVMLFVYDIVVVGWFLNDLDQSYEAQSFC